MCRSTYDFAGWCYHCKRLGHKASDCPNNIIDAAFMANGKRFTRTTTICDSGASSHMFNSDDGMYNVRETESLITIGNGKTLKATKQGSIRATVLQKDGSTLDIDLHDVKFVPGLAVNLFSLTCALSNGWQLANDGVQILLRKGSHQLIFDRLFPTDMGVLCGIELLPKPDTAHLGAESPPAATSNNTPKAKKHWEINRFHQVYNHANEETLRATATAHGWTVSGTLMPCAECQISNINKRPVPTSRTETKATAVGERIFIDGTSVQTPSMGGNKYWHVVVDDYSHQVWSLFMPRKSDQVSRLYTFIKKMKGRGTPVKAIRCDNAGENKELQKKCLASPDPDIVAIKFEFTAWDSPNYNGRAE